MCLYSIIDVEATGGNAKTDRMTEIAIFLFDGKKIVDKFSSLVNPERSIPPYVQNLTGINDEMASTAPHFSEISDKILELTKDSFLVAHDCKFDYDFISSEFKKIGITDLSMPRLCTLGLSQTLLPELPYYSLGKLCKTLEIPLKGRHRAEGDAFATVQLFKKLLKADKNREFIPRTMVNDNSVLNSCSLSSNKGS